MSIPTSSRLLALLSLLQQRREWSGRELAEQLGVGPRTIRRDVEKLRGLDYPIEAASGVAGGYRLGAGAKLPPLLLDDAEAPRPVAPSRPRSSTRARAGTSSPSTWSATTGGRSASTGSRPAR